MLHTISKNQIKYNSCIVHEDLWYTVVPNDYTQGIHLAVFCHGLMLGKPSFKGHLADSNPI